MIRLCGCVGLSGNSLSAYVAKHDLIWRGPCIKLMTISSAASWQPRTLSNLLVPLEISSRLSIHSYIPYFIHIPSWHEEIKLTWFIISSWRRYYPFTFDLLFHWEIMEEILTEDKTPLNEKWYCKPQAIQFLMLSVQATLVKNCKEQMGFSKQNATTYVVIMGLDQPVHPRSLIRVCAIR